MERRGNHHASGCSMGLCICAACASQAAPYLWRVAQIKFGTDGWRAVIAEDFTFTNLDRVAQATAEYWKRNPVPGTQKRVAVGYDRRFLSDQFAHRVAEI